MTALGKLSSKPQSSETRSKGVKHEGALLPDAN
jgi:hypothetical protein